jgi:quercetin dioxygenase-like cupin family protein
VRCTVAESHADAEAVSSRRAFATHATSRNIVAMRSLLLGLLLATAGCATRSPQLLVGPLASGLDPFLASHPLAPGQSIRADEVARTPGSSFHVVQVRGGETPHRHVAHDLTALVLRGGGAITIDGVRHTVSAGDVSVVSRGTAHWFVNGGRDPSVTFVTFTPPLDAPDSEPVIDSSPDRR